MPIQQKIKKELKEFFISIKLGALLLIDLAVEYVNYTAQSIVVEPLIVFLINKNNIDYHRESVKIETRKVLLEATWIVLILMAIGFSVNWYQNQYVNLPCKYLVEDTCALKWEKYKNLRIKFISYLFIMLCTSLLPSFRRSNFVGNLSCDTIDRIKNIRKISWIIVLLAIGLLAYSLIDEKEFMVIIAFLLVLLFANFPIEKNGGYRCQLKD